MTRETSLDAYRAIKENGMLSKRRWEVYDILFREGPLTANEAFRAIAIENEKKANSLLSVSNARFTELRDMGVVKELAPVVCSVSGQRVIQWDVTSRLPVKFEKPKRTKCKACNGKGYHEDHQSRFDL